MSERRHGGRPAARRCGHATRRLVRSRARTTPPTLATPATALLSALATALPLALAAGGCRDRQAEPPRLVVENMPGQPIAPRRPGTRMSPLPPTESMTPSARPPAGEFTHVAGDGYEGWIRPPMSNWHFQPSAADIAALEAGLPSALAAAVARGDIASDVDLTRHARQYTGYRKNGREVIDVQFYCESARHLARKTVNITGGSACFVLAAYELDTGQFTYLRRR